MAKSPMDLAPDCASALREGGADGNGTNSEDNKPLLVVKSSPNSSPLQLKAGNPALSQQGQIFSRTNDGGSTSLMVTTRSQSAALRAAAAAIPPKPSPSLSHLLSDNDDNHEFNQRTTVTRRHDFIDDGGGYLCRGHIKEIKPDPIETRSGFEAAFKKTFSFPSLNQTPDTTGSPDGGGGRLHLFHHQPHQGQQHGEFSLKRPAQDVDGTAGGSSNQAPVQQGSRAKRPRRMYTPEQVQVLEKMFATNEYPTAQDRILLSAVTQLSTEKVKVWFQNRRSRERRRRQNQIHNSNAAAMKRGAAQGLSHHPAPPVTSKCSQQQLTTPGFQSVNPSLHANIQGLQSKTFTARAEPPNIVTGQHQQLVQALSQGNNTSNSNSNPYLWQHQHTDHNNNNDNNNNTIGNIGTGQNSQFTRSAAALGPTGAKQVLSSSIYNKIYAGSNTLTGTGQHQPAAAAGSSNDTCRDPAPSSVVSHYSKPETSSYTPLVPAWSQAWPMFPPAPQTIPHHHHHANQMPKMTQTPQQQQQQPMDAFCDNNNNSSNANTNKWLDNQNTTSYGVAGNTGSNVNANKSSVGGGFPCDHQQAYPAYPAMIPAAYIPYGYPYYSTAPAAMYQNPGAAPQVPGLYPRQQQSHHMSSYLGCALQAADTPTSSPPTAPPVGKQQSVGSSTPAVVSHAVRQALQKKLEVATSSTVAGLLQGKTYNWHQQGIPDQQTVTQKAVIQGTGTGSTAHHTPILEAHLSGSKPPGRGGDGHSGNQDRVLSDSSTLSTLERINSPSVKPLATSSPNQNNQPVTCEVPFPPMSTYNSSNKADMADNMIRMQDLWGSGSSHHHHHHHQQRQQQDTQEAMATGDNVQFYDKNNNSMGTVMVPTPYPHIAGYYNDFSYAQAANTMSCWSNQNNNTNRTANISPQYSMYRVDTNQEWATPMGGSNNTMPAPSSNTIPARYSTDVTEEPMTVTTSEPSGNRYPYLPQADNQSLLPTSNHHQHVYHPVLHSNPGAAGGGLTQMDRRARAMSRGGGVFSPGAGPPPPVTSELTADEAMTPAAPGGGGSEGYSDISSNDVDGGGEEEDDDEDQEEEEEEEEEEEDDDGSRSTSGFRTAVNPTARAKHVSGDKKIEELSPARTPIASSPCNKDTDAGEHQLPIYTISDTE